MFILTKQESKTDLITVVVFDMDVMQEYMTNLFVDGFQKTVNLKKMGCSDCNRIKVGTSFTFNKTKCFYCGSIQTKNGRMYLVYNASTYVQNGFYVDMVEQEWFSKHIKEIVIEYQTKEQIEAIKQTARYYKKRIEEREKRYK